MPLPSRFRSDALCWTALFALTSPVCAGAQDAPIALPPVTVEGERVSPDGNGVVHRVPVDALAAPDLADLLATLPGVQVRSSGGLGSYSEASLRGSSGRQVRLLLDGLPLDTGGGEAASLSLVSPLLLETAEIHKGRVPIGLGSGLAGIINLRSRAQLPAPLLASARLGSFGERQFHAAAQASEALQIAAGTQRADNDFLYRNLFRPFDPEDPDRLRREHRQNAGAEQHYGYVRYRGPVQVTAHLLDHTQELPNRRNASTSQTELATTAYALALSSPPEATWQTSLSHRYTEERFSDPAAQLALRSQKTRDDTHRSLFSIGRGFEHWDVVLGLDRESYQSRDLIGERADSEARRIGAHGGAQWQYGQRWRVDGSLQLAWHRDESDNRERDEWRVEPAIGLGRDIGACIATINLGQRERLPTFFERYGDRGLFKGNPELLPERAVYADGGARCALDSKTHFELTAFGQDLRDAISPTYNGQGIGRSVNTDRATIYGVEASAGGALLDRWHWQLGATWQDTEDRSDVRANRGKQLPGRYEHQLNLSIERDWLGLRWQYAFRYEAGQFYDTPNLLAAEPVRRHDIGVRGAIDTLGWSLQWLNLRDDNFEQFNGFPTPGRRLLLALSWPYLASDALNRRDP